ncbi:pyocin activator PrtN family protein [Acinetobacter guillouiae]
MFKIDKSKRAPFMVHITELAKILDEEYKKASEDHVSLHQ